MLMMEALVAPISLSPAKKPMTPISVGNMAMPRMESHPEGDML